MITGETNYWEKKRMQTDNTSKEMCHSGEQFIPESLTDISSA
jgi:hypothetical protein